MAQSAPAPEDSTDLQRLATLIRQQAWPHARPLAAMLLKQRPANPEILVLCATVALYGARDPARAERLLAAVLDRHPDNRAALRLLHTTLKRRQRDDAAQRIARRLLSLPSTGRSRLAN